MPIITRYFVKTLLRYCLTSKHKRAYQDLLPKKELKMNDSKLIAIGNDIYELSMSDLEKYKLDGERLTEARNFIEETKGDVAGQRLGEQSSSRPSSIYDGPRTRGKGY